VATQDIRDASEIVVVIIIGVPGLAAPGLAAWPGSRPERCLPGE
jgi:hypothetical protein